MVAERILPFKIYNYLFFYDRGLHSVWDLCVRVLIQEETIYNLFRKNIILNKDIFIPTFINFYLSGNVNMFVCPNEHDSFDTFFGCYSEGIIENHYFLFKRYLEILMGFFKIPFDKKYFLFFPGFLFKINLKQQIKLT